MKRRMIKSGVQTYGIALYQWSIFKEIPSKWLSFTCGGAEVLSRSLIVQLLHGWAWPELFSLSLSYVSLVMANEMKWR
jgi:hypothetical protein